MDIRSHANALLGYYWGNKPVPVDPASIAQSRGVSVVPLPPHETASGWFRFIEGKPLILYNANEPLTRQRFTIAHELGHYELSHGERPRDSVAAFNLYNFDPIEVDANRFAAEILMPEQSVRWMAGQGKFDLAKLAQTFGVSEVAMKYRLKNLGIL